MGGPAMPYAFDGQLNPPSEIYLADIYEPR
jgi:hypothetical protein